MWFEGALSCFQKKQLPSSMSRVNKKAKRRQVLDVESVADSKDEGPVVDAEAASAQSDASEVALELPAKKKKRKKKPLPASADPSGHSEVEPTDNDDDKAAAVAVVVTEEELGLVGKKKKKKKKIPSVAMGEDLVSVAAAPPALPLKRKKSKPKGFFRDDLFLSGPGRKLCVCLLAAQRLSRASQQPMRAPRPSMRPRKEIAKRRRKRRPGSLWKTPRTRPRCPLRLSQHIHWPSF